MNRTVRTRVRRIRTVSCLLVLACLAERAGARDTPGGPEIHSVPLAISADRPLVWAGEDLLAISSAGAYQLIPAWVPEPARSLPASLAAVSPVSGKPGAWVLDTEGTLWLIGRERAEAVGTGLEGVIAAAPGSPQPALLFEDRVRLPGGGEVSLPGRGGSLWPLEDGGFWVSLEGGGACLDAGGRIRWLREDADMNPSPACLGVGRLFLGTPGGDLAAFDVEDGREAFRYRTGGAVVSPPAVAGDGVIFASRDHLVRALDPARGRLLWQLRLGGRPDFGPMEVSGGWLFAVTSGSRIVVCSAEGRVRWSWTVPEGEILTPPAAREDRIAVLAWTEGNTPTLHLLRLPTGSAPAGTAP